MSLNILETLNSALGGPLVRQLSSSLGESEDATRSAVHSTGPTLLASMLQRATQPSGVADLFRMVTDDRVDDGIVGKLSSVMGNRGSVDALANTGQGFGRELFGQRGTAIADSLASTSGIKPGSAMRLLSLGLPVMFGVVRKYLMRNNIGPGGFASLLFEQRGALEKAGLDKRITNAMGIDNVSSLFSSVTPDARAARPTSEPPRVPTRAREARRPWLPWAIAAGLAVLAFTMWGTYRADRRGEQTAIVPTGESTTVYFETDEVALSDTNRQKLMRVAQAAKDEARPVAITGYADRSGNADQNKQMAQGRAIAVRDALVADGVDESLIVVGPPSEVTGSGNDREARRVEIQVR